MSRIFTRNYILLARGNYFSKGKGLGPWIRLSCLMVAIALIFAFCSSDHSGKDLPNIIILYADDMGFGDLACQNPDSKIPTPHLDQLVEEGMRFTDGHSSSGICTPSRYALLTGRYHWRDFHGIVGPMGQPAFKDNQFTLAQMLQDHGYHTACVGKWHLGWDWEAIRNKSWTTQDSMILFGRKKHFYPPEAYDWTMSIPGGPLDRGFNYYYGDGTINFPPYTWMENDRVVEIPTTTMRHPEGVALEGNWEARPGPAIPNWDFCDVLPTLTEKAVEYVQGRADSNQPFFLYVPFNSPHAPIVPDEPFQGKSQAGAYGDFVYQTDWAVGQILEALSDIGKSKNTIVVFTADNGPERYAYERIRNFDHQSYWPFRGLKRDVYEGGHHVPFIVKWPGEIPAGSVCTQVIHQADLLKTFSEIIQTSLPAGLMHDSHDFSEVWKNPNLEQTIRSVTVHNTFADKYALRQGDWLYINGPDGYHSKVPTWIDSLFNYEKNLGEVSLFNLSEDLGQRNNLAAEMPEKVSELQQLLTQAQKKETFESSD